MLFITNRIPKQGDRFSLVDKDKVGQKFDFDLNDNTSCQSIFFCERTGEGKYQEIGNSNFFSELKASACKQMLVYIHGFSNLPEDVFKAVEEFQKLCDKEKEKEVMVVPLIWPCDNDFGIMKDYWDDQKAADASGLAFGRALGKFISWRNAEENREAPCLKRINVLAHSMGNRVLRETLIAWNKYDLPNGVPLIFKNTFMVAADVVNECFEVGEPGRLICDSSRNAVVYYAADDLALRASKVANLKNKIASRRLGHTGPEDMQLTPKNVYAIDCDDVNETHGDPKGHSYFRSGKEEGKPSPVFNHIFSVLVSGRVFQNETQRTTILK